MPSARQPSHPCRLLIESLEDRLLLTAAGPVFFSATEPNDTLDAATLLGEASHLDTFTLTGQIGDSPSGASDVDWFQFTLDQAARVQLSADATAMLSLYRQSPFDFGDPYTFLGHRLLEQGQSLDRDLAPGTYSVAVSGQGNLYFHPYLAASGYAGQTGAYQVSATVSPLARDPFDGPVLLNSDSAGSLSRSPLVLRLGFDKPLDFSSIILDDNVQLRQFTGGGWVSVSLTDYNLNDAGDELRLYPMLPLEAGQYEVALGGNSMNWLLPVTALDGTFLGADADHLDGQDLVWSFEVSSSDITELAPRELGDLTTGGLWHHEGTIGDDPADPFSPAEIDYYRFSLTGTGTYLVGAEVLAGRIGSPLDPTVALYRVDALGNRTLVAFNNDTFNLHQGSGRDYPLAVDALLFAGLGEGDYLLEVASQVDSGGGQLRGDYTLTLLVEADNSAPWVVGVTPAPGTALDAPPTRFFVQFSEPVPLAQLAASAVGMAREDQLPSVFIEGQNGRIYPVLESYDAATNTATFLLLEALTPGAYTFTLSGSLGLTDLAGNVLTGNSASGDWVMQFSVGGGPRGVGGDPLQWSYLDPLASPHDQTLGVLFPQELASGITITRGPEGIRPEIDDSYTFTILQSGPYTITVSGVAVQDGALVQLVDDTNNIVLSAYQSGASTVNLPAPLTAGTYRLRVIGDGQAAVAGETYTVTISSAGLPDSPPPLTSGPAPALRLQLSQGLPMPPPGAPAVILPPLLSGTPSVGDGATSAAALSLRLSAPSGSLLSLGSGPLGEVPGSGMNSIRVVLGGASDLPLVDLLVGLTVFTQWDLSGTWAPEVDVGLEWVPAPTAERVVDLPPQPIERDHVEVPLAPTVESPRLTERVPAPQLTGGVADLALSAPLPSETSTTSQGGVTESPPPEAPAVPRALAFTLLGLLLGAAALVPFWTRGFSRQKEQGV